MKKVSSCADVAVRKSCKGVETSRQKREQLGRKVLWWDRKERNNKHLPLPSERAHEISLSLQQLVTKGWNAVVKTRLGAAASCCKTREVGDHDGWPPTTNGLRVTTGAKPGGGDFVVFLVD
ncbi:hypothetical protein Ae201684_007509 [Aphanomyces euteiches]|uniref:Uncharacterized protein n=1 Tax=Aphanomyces euteiches TaxID=100861 RepID=A0A6G0X917_9STRA|nr:hypothetical protein Ae201684_007509 [Aphanomyces euteiches]